MNACMAARRLAASVKTRELTRCVRDAFKRIDLGRRPSPLITQILWERTGPLSRIDIFREGRGVH